MREALVVELEETADDVRMLRLRGDLDGRGVPQMVAAWRRVKAPGSVLVIHLAAVEFISSSGVGALLTILEESNDRGQRVFLMAPSANVRSVIRLLGLEAFLPVIEEGAEIPPGKAA